MKLIYGDDERVAAWVSERIDQPIIPPYVAIGAERNAKLCGGAVFNNWNGANIELTLASERCLTRGTIGAIYRYVFVQSKATRVTIHTRRSNKVMRALAPRLGFVFEYTAPRFYGPSRQDDAFIFALFPHQAERFM